MGRSRTCVHDDLLDAVAEVPLRIDGHGDLPVYLQIRHQISYLISSQRLPSGARLPAVRTLAEDINVSPQTVAKAFRYLQDDGLIESHAGRGSYVRTFEAPDRRVAQRDARLSEVLREARLRARSLGFTDSATAHRLSALISQEPCAARVLFVDADPHIAAKYASRLERHLSPHVEASGVGLEEVLSGEPAAMRLLDVSFYVLAFARTVPSLERILDPERHEITPIASSVRPSTIELLNSLGEDLKVAVLTEERYIHAALNLIATYSAIDPHEVSVFTAETLDDLLRDVEDLDRVFYTFSVGDLVRAHPHLQPTKELEFDVSQDSLVKLRQLLLEHGETNGG
jgi:DNA-binding transcriptional regulator YhcF (GntR family)